MSLLQRRKGGGIMEKEIKMPIYYIINDEETGERVYDFEEMADELENRICKALNRNVLITISEVEEEK
tara:strand:+ start:3684 stop:3887 length:204 start_codon:yes stop_codon:yes gene_type:complete